MFKTYITKLSLITLLLAFCSSCEQERIQPELNTVGGGGELNTFTAYTINSMRLSGSNVSGRIVFWKTSLNQTLIQVSLHNTISGTTYPTFILEGAIGTEVNIIRTLDSVSGDTGEFSENKFFVIADTDFYDSIPTMDSHINIQLSSTDNTIVASGNLGANANPVDLN